MALRISESGKTEVLLTGLVVDEWSQYLGDGDTIHGVVYFDEEAMGFKRYNTGWWKPDYEVDAPEDVLALYRAEKALAAAQAEVDRKQDEVLRRLNEEATPSRGKRCTVVKGRKIPLGTEVEVLWAGETRWGYRAKVLLPDGEEAWTDLWNLEVIRETATQPAA